MFENASELTGIQSVRGAAWVYAGCPQNFIRINIANARNARLVHEGAFYWHCFLGANAFFEGGGSEVFMKRLGAQFSEVSMRARYLFFYEGDLCKFAHVRKSEVVSIFKTQHKMNEGIKRVE